MISLREFSIEGTESVQEDRRVSFAVMSRLPRRKGEAEDSDPRLLRGRRPAHDARHPAHALTALVEVPIDGLELVLVQAAQDEFCDLPRLLDVRP